MTQIDSGPTTIAASVRGLRKTYGDGPTQTTALDGIDLEIQRGTLTAIMGPSGSGKSTLMHVFAGLDTATSGRVTIGDTDITDLDDDALTLLRRRKLGFVFQAFNLVPTLSVIGNIELPFELDGRKPSAEERSWIAELLGKLGLSGFEARRPHELSGGQQQRVAIARGNLDSKSSRAVLALLGMLTRDYQQTVVLVTHDPVAASYADRVVFIADGMIVQDVPRNDAKALSDIILMLEVTA
jgi:putative ABC transport system ATP-binding protein